MKKNVMLLAAAVIVVVLLGVIFIMFPSGTANAPTTTNTPAGIADLISVSAPLKNATVASPLTVAGEARGTWYFEASFPVLLKDANGAVIAEVPAQAQSDLPAGEAGWMTENFVPFVATLTFPAQATGSKGTLILKKDNPSGDPARDQSVEIPVTF